MGGDPGLANFTLSMQAVVSQAVRDRTLALLQLGADIRGSPAAAELERLITAYSKARSGWLPVSPLQGTGVEPRRSFSVSSSSIMMKA